MANLFIYHISYTGAILTYVSINKNNKIIKKEDTNHIV